MSLGAFLLQDLNALIAKPTSSGLKSEALFEELKKRISSNPELVKKVKGIIQWNVTKNGKMLGQWVLDLKTGTGAVIEGSSSSLKPDCTITVSDDDLIGLAAGKLNAQQLFMKGKLKVTGNIMMTVNLDKLFKEHSKM
jgi:3-hydroxyacyl-CoA dehydrogenase/3a,7a,12a-trihydroxy-5b-cholest-24-enoyl-CoA hydratase